MAHSLRSEAGLRVRQPLSELVCNAQLSDELFGIIADEVNVKKAAFHDADSGDGWIVKESGALRVALNTVLTPALKEEGIVREFIRHINSFRKEQGLTPKDVITLEWDTPSADLVRIIEAYKDEIAASVIAGALVRGVREGMQTVSIGEQEIRLGLTKVA